MRNKQFAPRRLFGVEDGSSEYDEETEKMMKPSSDEEFFAQSRRFTPHIISVFVKNG